MSACLRGAPSVTRHTHCERSTSLQLLRLVVIDETMMNQVRNDTLIDWEEERSPSKLESHEG